jgi:RNA polymerase sigma-70 factor (ECF subfamily)
MIGGGARAPGPGAAPTWSATIDPRSRQPAGSTAEPLDALERDRAVVDAVLGGDRDAFRVLVEREAGGIIRACHRILGDRLEAEDVAQEAFVTAYRSLASWRADGPFGAWLARIAVRNAVRRASRRREVPWISPAALAAGQDDATEPGVRMSPDPMVVAIRAERSAAVRRAVARLDEPYRETVALRFFAERSLAEIAAETGRPLGTVKTHLRRGLIRLRERLQAEGER